MNRRGKLTLLLFCFCICATAALLHCWEYQQEQLRPVELFNAVEQQLAAFRANDFSSAYHEASSSLQQHWSLDQFSAMIRNEYSRISRTERVEFGPWQRRGRHAIVEVFFVNHDGTVIPCVYSLISEADGWKVDGARWIRGWPQGQRLRGLRS